MRVIHVFDNADHCRRFAAYLRSVDIACLIETGRSNWQLLIEAEQDRQRAGLLLEEFLAKPDDPRFQVAQRWHRHLERSVEQAEVHREAADQGYVVSQSAVPMGPVTLMLIILCVAVFIQSDWGGDATALRWLTLTELQFNDDGSVRSVGKDLSAIFDKGQVWRLISPIVIHFGPLHIIFNMLWLKDLGSIIEHRFGYLRLLAFVVISGCLSNLAEFGMQLWLDDRAPYLGGFSGVVYGLLGLLWIRGRLEPRLGLQLPTYLVNFMLIWLIFGFFINSVGGSLQIANWAHLGGLIVGVAWAWVAHQLAQLRRRS